MPRRLAQLAHATVIRAGQYVYVEPHVPALDQLLTTRIELGQGAHGRAALRRNNEPLQLHFLRDRGTGSCAVTPGRAFPAGLLPAICRVLRGEGVLNEVRMVDYGPALLPEPCLSGCSSSSSQHALGHFIFAHERGLVEAPPGAAKLVALCLEIVWGFPTVSIAFVCENTSQCLALVRALKKAKVDASLARSGIPDRITQVVVGTTLSMACHDWDHRAIIVFLNARDAVGERGQLAIPEAHRARLFAFTRSIDEFSPYEWDYLAAWFGFSRLRLPAADRAALDVEVAFYSFRHQRQRLDAVGSFEPIKKGVLECQQRNDLVVRLARQAADADLESLRISEKLTLSLRKKPPRRVVILAATAHHARRLAAELPDWVLVTTDACQPTNPANMDAAPHQIVTVAAAEQVDLGRCDVIIRADAGLDASSLPKDADPWRGRTHQLPLVDFRDRHHPELHNRSTQRLKAYARLGWGGVDLPAEHVLSQDFLDCRPGAPK